MATPAEIVFRLTEASLASDDRQQSLHAFVEATGWYPSDEMVEYPGTEQFASGHLLVEHGMANTAVISFLRTNRPFAVLDKASQLRLLELSYNNLVDWHLLPDTRGLTAIYNRTDPPRDFRIDRTDAWRADAFATVTGQKVRPELKALDEAFISTVSYWKRVIGGEIGKKVGNEHLSALFNVLIFLRAYEDHRRRLGGLAANRLLVDLIASDPGLPVKQLCRRALAELGENSFPSFIQSQVALLDALKTLAPETVQQLVSDFYKNRFCPYNYDFSLISKHALSRIYEHYVSVLRSPNGDQPQLFPGLAEETTNKALGAYYTPQYIARFFARYLQEHTPPREFRGLRIADPACGSGIFIRTVLELRCDPLDPLATPEAVRESFRRILGLDVDPNACEATRLSLSLLHLVLTDEFPDSLNILPRDAVEYVQSSVDEHGTYGAVIANPPYIRWESQPEAWKERAAAYLGDLRRGKLDAYVAVLKAGLDLVRKGGFLLYVLPHTFLYADNTSKLRELISRDFWVRLVADLSDIKVFEDVSSYTILLIAQRKIDLLPAPPATIVKCRSEVGEALSTALRGRIADNEFFLVCEASQAVFTDRTWKLLPPRQQLLLDQLSRLPQLSDMVQILQGVITGADDVFIRNKADVPVNEKCVWRPLLADREMMPYSVPREVSQVIFYPVEANSILTDVEMRKKYPQSWSYLKRHEKELKSRKALSKPGTAWWRPLWLRDPKALFSPKVICPHLMLTPRFGIDPKGRFVVTRSPFIVPTEENRSGGNDFLKFLVAILNSVVGFWQIGVLSHKYSRQYAMMEGKTLGVLRVPDPRSLPARPLRKLIGLVDRRIEEGFSPGLEQSIDRIVAELYGLTEQDLSATGLI